MKQLSLIDNHLTDSWLIFNLSFTDILLISNWLIIDWYLTDIWLIFDWYLNQMKQLSKDQSWLGLDLPQMRFDAQITLQIALKLNSNYELKINNRIHSLSIAELLLIKCIHFFSSNVVLKLHWCRTHSCRLHWDCSGLHQFNQSNSTPAAVPSIFFLMFRNNLRYLEIFLDISNF